MASSVYVETSVISYFTARPSRDIVTAARQTLTQEWWENARENYDLYVSVLVVEESKGGGTEAAQRRLEFPPYQQRRNEGTNQKNHRSGRV